MRLGGKYGWCELALAPGDYNLDINCLAMLDGFSPEASTQAST